MKLIKIERVNKRSQKDETWVSSSFTRSAVKYDGKYYVFSPDKEESEITEESYLHIIDVLSKD